MLNTGSAGNILNLIAFCSGILYQFCPYLVYGHKIEYPRASYEVRGYSGILLADLLIF